MVLLLHLLFFARLLLARAVLAVTFLRVAARLLSLLIAAVLRLVLGLLVAFRVARLALLVLILILLLLAAALRLILLLRRRMLLQIVLHDIAVVSGIRVLRRIA